MLFIVSANVYRKHIYLLRQVNVIFASIGYNGLCMDSRADSKHFTFGLPLSQNKRFYF